MKEDTKEEEIDPIQKLMNPPQKRKGTKQKHKRKKKTFKPLIP